jgi:hypothetical protein
MAMAVLLVASYILVELMKTGDQQKNELVILAALDDQCVIPCDPSR